VPEWHYRKPETPLASDESGLVSVGLGYRDIIVPRAEIQRAVPRRAAECVQAVVDQRKWIAVLIRDGVESPVVHTKSKGPVFLFDKHHIGGPRASCRFYDSIFQHPVNLFVDVCLVLERLPSQWLSNGSMVTCTDRVFYQWHSSDIMISGRKDRPVLRK